MLGRACVVLVILVAACSDSTGTTASDGGTPDQGPVECFASYTCHKGGCDGPIAHSGCSDCSAGETDDRQCHDGGQDSGVDADANAERMCTQECFRAITCRKGGCSGQITSTGCCSCLSDEIDDIACSTDAATDG